MTGGKANPSPSLTGAALRARRLALGLKQAEVAAAAGISASYLNLIEHDRRRLAGGALARLALVLDLDPAELHPEPEGLLAEDLRAAAAHAGTLAVGAGDLDRAEDFAARFPGWASVLIGLYRRAEGLERAVEALNDRMTHDPHLSAAVHEVLSAVASVRSTAAILAETEDIDPEWQARFHRNLDQDSARLAEGARALVAWLDSGDQYGAQGMISPLEEVEGWLAARDWQADAPEEGPVDGRSGRPTGGLAGGEDETAGLSTAARVLARTMAARAAADAAALPDPAFGAALTRAGGDPLAVAMAFGAPVLSVFRRIATRPGSGAGLVVCDASGSFTFRKPAEGFALPRFGAGCPLWPLYTVLGRPMQPVAAVVQTAGRGARRFRILAFCEPHYPGGFAGPELREAAMLILAEDPGAPVAGPVLPVGPTCRICPRTGCAARREPSILTEPA